MCGTLPLAACRALNQEMVLRSGAGLLRCHFADRDTTHLACCLVKCTPTMTGSSTGRGGGSLLQLVMAWPYKAGMIALNGGVGTRFNFRGLAQKTSRRYVRHGGLRLGSNCR